MPATNTPARLNYSITAAAESMLAAAREIYLTPTARLRIPVPHGAKVDDGSGDDLFD